MTAGMLTPQGVFRRQLIFVVAGGPPTGPAGGDLSGTYPNPTVVQASNTFVANAVAVKRHVSFGFIVVAAIDDKS